MPTETGQALLILVVFVLPGFVTLLLKARTHEVRPDSSGQFERLFSAIFYSLLVYVPLVLLGAALGLDRADIRDIYTANDELWRLAVVVCASGLVFPAAIAYGSLRWQRSRLRIRLLSRLGIELSHRTPTAWDYFFKQRMPALLRVTLKSGEVVGGYYGPISFAAYGQHGRDLYLQEQWEIEEETFRLLRPVERSIGIWLPGQEIIQTELYAVTDEQLALFEQAGLELTATDPERTTTEADDGA